MNAEGNGTEATSNEVTPGVTATVPAAPTALTATADDAEVSLTWTAGSDGGRAITKHQYRKKEGAGAYDAWTDILDSAADEANAESYTVTGLTNGTAYTFQVRAVNAEGNGAEATSNAVMPGTTDTTAPTVVKIGRDFLSPTNADSIQWSVVFNEDVKNVDDTDFHVTGTSALVEASSLSPSLFTVKGERWRPARPGRHGHPVHRGRPQHYGPGRQRLDGKDADGKERQ